MVYNGFKCVEASNTFKFKTNALMDLLVGALRVNFKQLLIRWGGFGEKNKKLAGGLICHVANKL